MGVELSVGTVVLVHWTLEYYYDVTHHASLQEL